MSRQQKIRAWAIVNKDGIVMLFGEALIFGEKNKILAIHYKDTLSKEIGTEVRVMKCEINLIR